jgi:hypothetical protein
MGLFYLLGQFILQLSYNCNAKRRIPLLIPGAGMGEVLARERFLIPSANERHPS